MLNILISSSVKFVADGEASYFVKAYTCFIVELEMAVAKQNTEKMVYHFKKSNGSTNINTY